MTTRREFLTVALAATVAAALPLARAGAAPKSLTVSAGVAVAGFHGLP